jgi:NaMN:DMB phosphoribosyltransferase
LHVNVEPDSVEVNPDDELVDVVGFAGPDVIVVSGAVVSAAALMVQVHVAGVASVLPAASVARTLTVCEPVVRPL